MKFPVMSPKPLRSVASAASESSIWMACGPIFGSRADRPDRAPRRKKSLRPLQRVYSEPVSGAHHGGDLHAARGRKSSPVAVAQSQHGNVACGRVDAGVDLIALSWLHGVRRKHRLREPLNPQAISSTAGCPRHRRLCAARHFCAQAKPRGVAAGLAGGGHSTRQSWACTRGGRDHADVAAARRGHMDRSCEDGGTWRSGTTRAHAIACGADIAMLGAASLAPASQARLALGFPTTLNTAPASAVHVRNDGHARADPRPRRARGRLAELRGCSESAAPRPVRAGVFQRAPGDAVSPCSASTVAHRLGRGERVVENFIPARLHRHEASHAVSICAWMRIHLS